jgi:uncharacterized Tic20 family protein
MFIALFVGALLMLIAVGILVMIAIGILMTVIPIIAAINANEGKHYRYPLTYRFIK